MDCKLIWRYPEIDAVRVAVHVCQWAHKCWDKLIKSPCVTFCSVSKASLGREKPVPSCLPSGTDQLTEERRADISHCFSVTHTCTRRGNRERYLGYTQTYAYTSLSPTHTCLHVKLYLTIHKAEIPADLQTWSSLMETLEGITGSTEARRDVCRCSSGGASSSSLLCFWGSIWLCSRCLFCHPSDPTPPHQLATCLVLQSQERWDERRERGERLIICRRTRSNAFAQGQAISEPLQPH